MSELRGVHLLIQAGKAVTLLAGLAFACGFVIHVIYLGVLGVEPGELLTARYVYSGAWFILFLSVTLGFALAFLNRSLSCDWLCATLLSPLLLLLCAGISSALWVFVTDLTRGMSGSSVLTFPATTKLTLSFVLSGAPVIAAVAHFPNPPALLTRSGMRPTAIALVSLIVSAGAGSALLSILAPKPHIASTFMLSLLICWWVGWYLCSPAPARSEPDTTKASASIVMGPALQTVVVMAGALVVYAYAVYPGLPVTIAGGQVQSVHIETHCPQLADQLSRYEQIYLVDRSHQFITLYLSAPSPEDARILQLPVDQVRAIFTHAPF